MKEEEMADERIKEGCIVQIINGYHAGEYGIVGKVNINWANPDSPYRDNPLYERYELTDTNGVPISAVPNRIKGYEAQFYIDNLRFVSE